MKTAFFPEPCLQKSTKYACYMKQAAIYLRNIAYEECLNLMPFYYQQWQSYGCFVTVKKYKRFFSDLGLWG